MTGMQSRVSLTPGKLLSVAAQKKRKRLNNQYNKLILLKRVGFSSSFLYYRDEFGTVFVIYYAVTLKNFDL
jgi:hypothetical protein